MPGALLALRSPLLKRPFALETCQAPSASRCVLPRVTRAGLLGDLAHILGRHWFITLRRNSLSSATGSVVRNTRSEWSVKQAVTSRAAPHIAHMSHRGPRCRTYFTRNSSDTARKREIPSLLRTFKELGIVRRCCVVTGSRDDRLVAEARRIGVLGYIQKSSTVEEFRRSVHDIMRGVPVFPTASADSNPRVPRAGDRRGHCKESYARAATCTESDQSRTRCGPRIGAGIGRRPRGGLRVDVEQSHYPKCRCKNRLLTCSCRLS